MGGTQAEVVIGRKGEEGGSGGGGREGGVGERGREGGREGGGRGEGGLSFYYSLEVFARVNCHRKVST